MKLYQIPNYLDKKIAKNNSFPRNFQYIYFKNGIWKDQDGVVYYITSFEIEHNDWEEYKGHPQRKRFWEWKVHPLSSVARSSGVYLDDDGKPSDSKVIYKDWDLIKKKKIENDFIDCILVDGKWELEE